MVEFNIPLDVDARFFNLIPNQRIKVKQYFDQNILVSYSLNQDRTKLWAIFLASSSSELESFIEDLPLSSYMTYKFQELMFHESQEKELPYISLN